LLLGSLCRWVRELGAEAIEDCAWPKSKLVADVVGVGCEECVTVDPQMSREFGPIGRAHSFKTADDGADMLLV